MTPVAVFATLCWFSKELKTVLGALAYFIKERKFKGTFPGGSVEVGGTEEVQKLINAGAIPPPAATSQVQEAKKFILRDDSGRARAEIGMMGIAESPYPVIRMFNSKGQVELQLIATDDGPSAVAVGTPRRNLVYLVANEKEQGSALMMIDAKGTSRIFLTTDSLNLANSSVFLAGATAKSDGTPSISLRDKNGECIYRAP